jgi:predicted Zn-dependent peptidase
MLLFVVGDVDIEKTMNLIKENQANRKFDEPTEIKNEYIFETNEVAKKESTLQMDVSTPKVAVGIKNNESKLQGNQLMKYELALDIIFEYLFSKSSDYYQQLLEEELINDSFGYELTIEYSFGFGVISSDTNKPEELKARLIEMLLKARNLDMSEEDFTTIKNKMLGSTIKALNSPENIANSFTRYKFNDMNMFDVIKTYEELTLDDLKNVLPFFDELAITSNVVLPHDNK